MKKVFLVMLSILLIFELVSAVSWEYGSLHQHTGYSTWDGYDGIPENADDCEPNILELNERGYSVAELKERATNMNLAWLAFSDHSYCIDSDEFNTVKLDCQSAQSNEFSCLWGEELSVAEIVPDIELAYGCDPTGLTDDGEAHFGVYGIDDLIHQTPSATHCPETPTVTTALSSINSQGGLSIINHPYSTQGILEFLDFESIDVTSGESGIEIWNSEWDIDDLSAFQKWLDKLQQGERVYAFGGTDEHGYPSIDNYNLVRINSLTHSELESGLEEGANVVSNNGYVIIEAKTNSQPVWTQMGGELEAFTGEVLTISVEHNVVRDCTLRVSRSKIGTYLEHFHSYGISAGSNQFDIPYPLAETGDYYFRADCVGSGGDDRIYTNPIWVQVLSPSCQCSNWVAGSCDGGSCGPDQRQYTRSCNPTACAAETKCEFDPICSDPGGSNNGAGVTNCIEPGYEWCIEYQPTGSECDASLALNLYENVNDINWGPVNDGNDPYVIGEYTIGWKSIDAEQMYYDCTEGIGCNGGGCNCEEIANEDTRVTVTAPGIAVQPDILGWDDDLNDACWAWFWLGQEDFEPNYGPENPLYVLECFDDNDCSASQFCDKSGSWDQWSCVQKYSDGNACTSASQCQSGYCDDDGVGQVDDNWCFTPHNTYFDGEEPSYCEYSTSNGIIDCDERQAGDDLNRCVGVLYYEEECSSMCGYEDITSMFECGETGCSCAQPLCDGLTTGSDISTCSGEFDYFADQCSSSASGEDRGDNICRSSSFASGCTADPECNGVIAGTGSCDSECNYISNQPPSTPTTILCDGSLCTNNETFSNNLAINCSGSVDPESDAITYTIDAYYSNESFGDWWNVSWSSRKNISVTENSGSTLNNYSVRIDVNYENNMQPFFDDLRFVDSENEELDYWIERKIESSLASVWVRIPEISPSSSEEIYMYYGNPEVDTSGNGSNVFFFFDDFIDLSKIDFIEETGSGYVENIDNDYLQIYTYGSENVGIAVYEEVSKNLPYSIYLDLVNMDIDAPQQYHVGDEEFFRVFDNTGSHSQWKTASNIPLHNDYFSYPFWDSATFGNHKRMSWRTTAGRTTKIYQEDGLVLNRFQSPIANMSGNFVVGDNRTDDEYHGGNFTIDWLAVTHSYVDPEPSYLVGSEERIDDPQWSLIGNHSESTTLDWNIDSLEPQSNIDLRCRAIDLDGSETYSGYYDPEINLTIAGSALLDVFDFEVVYQNLTEIVFSFAINNTLASSIDLISWSLDTDESVVDSQYDINLTFGEDALVFVYHNYSSSGSYTVVANATNGSLIDEEEIMINV